MATSEVFFKITSLIENPKNAVDISEIYDANLITNQGFHRDAMDMLSAPPCVTINKEVDQDETFINIMVPFEAVPFGDGESIPITDVYSGMTNADIDCIHMIDNYAIGQEITLAASHNNPIGAWFERRNGHLMMTFQYRKSLLDNLFVTNGVIHLMLINSLLFSFKKTSDDHIEFVKGATIELI